MFSIDDFCGLTGRSREYITALLSCLQNRYRCGSPGPLTLKSIKYPDGIKRWGNLNATEIYENSKTKIEISDLAEE